MKVGNSRTETIIVFAAVPFHGHQLYDQRISVALTSRYHVTYVEPPLSFIRAGIRPNLPRNDKSLDILQPKTVPFGGRRLLDLGSALWTLLLLWTRLLRKGRRCVGVLFLGGHPVLLFAFQRSRSLAIILDDYVAGASLIGRSPKRLLVNRDRIMSRATVVAAVSPSLIDSLQSARAIELIPPGCECLVSTSIERVENKNHLKAVFIGLLSDRIDFEALRDLQKAGLSITLIGAQQRTFTKGDELAQLLSAGQVHIMPEMPQRELQEELLKYDLGLIPYTESNFNKASFPLKVLEYLAVGLPVLSSNIPGLDWLRAPGVFVVRDGGSWTEQMEVLKSALTEDADPSVFRLRLQSFAGQHLWSERAERVLHALELT